MAKSKPKTSVKPVEKKKRMPYLLIFLAFWVIVFIIASIISKGNSNVMFGIGLAAFISFIMMMYQLLQQWEGKVQEIKTFAERRKSGNKWITENVTYAFIKLTDGKIKKVRSGGWKVGGHLKKEKWEMNVKVL